MTLSMVWKGKLNTCHLPASPSGSVICSKSATCLLDQETLGRRRGSRSTRKIFLSYALCTFKVVALDYQKQGSRSRP